ncbi:hypothetical protein THASP1DRAFT_31142 [Thamnocephalis sphaerospora]|uniref:Response regulatory domain-containing protein n=1 Tax=Thamnocephalis sphaerospora TaxID=78915 RepID=A0A4P9XNR3_9FUNG|nr:hypothetical protein THASP1DRAFT_31142 [Thamnocephalis sphaerospora]|eukprot:RKP07051.1 hypothetical protein THASP1DRAFT_31142 [Thamnocephalis sphaerospora]
MIMEMARPLEFENLMLVVLPATTKEMAFEDRIYLESCNVLITDFSEEEVVAAAWGVEGPMLHQSLLERFRWYVPSANGDEDLPAMPPVFEDRVPFWVANTPKLSPLEQNPIVSWGLMLRLLPIGVLPDEQAVFCIDVHHNWEWVTLQLAKPLRRDHFAAALQKYIGIRAEHRKHNARRMQRWRQKQTDTILATRKDSGVAASLSGSATPAAPADSQTGPASPCLTSASAPMDISGLAVSAHAMLRPTTSEPSQPQAPFSGVVLDARICSAPIVDEARLKREASEEALGSVAKRPRSMHLDKLILLVEDNPLNAKLMRHMLEKLGYVVKHVDNGKDAIRMCEREDFIFIFMDYQLPVMDGFQAAQRIRQQERALGKLRVPIAVLTGMEGVDEYLTKPISKAALVEVLQRWCGPFDLADSTS